MLLFKCLSYVRVTTIYFGIKNLRPCFVLLTLNEIYSLDNEDGSIKSKPLNNSDLKYILENSFIRR